MIDDDGNNISDYNVPGELCVRGPTVTPGYHDNTAETHAAFDGDGWLKTGDVAMCDGATRKWFILERKKDLIKVRGFQVSPSELEAVLLSHPGVAHAAVVGVRDQMSGIERPRAFIVPKAGEKVSGDQLRQHASERLAKYKDLSGGVTFVDIIPRNASGKVLRRMLADHTEKGKDGQTSKL